MHKTFVLQKGFNKKGMDRMGTNRVIRGGSWNNNARNVRAAYRNNREPDNRNNNLGFRCARAHAWSGCSLPEPVLFLTALCGK